MTGIAYELVRSARRTLAIHIRQDGRVQVRAPRRVPLYEIESFVRSRQDWIRRHLDEIAARPRLPAWGEAGRVWWHLGEPLAVAPGDKPSLPRRGRQPEIWLADGELKVSAGLWSSPEALPEALLRWQKARAAELLPARVAALVERFGEEWQPSSLRLRHMRSRWGSCSREHAITLNTQLASVPEACIDYVICHEFCHMREFNHGPRFHAWQDRLCPDWRERKAEMAMWSQRLREA